MVVELVVTPLPSLLVLVGLVMGLLLEAAGPEVGCAFPNFSYE